MTWNPFDWTAGPFLSFYLTTAVIVFVWGFSFKSSIGPAAQATRPLGALELAYLAGGARRLGDAVLLCLTSGNGAIITPKGDKITVTDQTPLDTLLGRPTLLPMLPNMTRQQFQKAVTSVVARVQGRLQELGYAPTDDQMNAFRMTVLPFVAVLLVFGIVKVLVGADRHHPVGILVCLLFITAFIAIVMAKSPTRTRAGNDVLKSYRDSHPRAARAPLDHELLFAVALSGAVVLSGTPYAPVYAASQTMSGGGDGGSGCGGGGGGGCGGCS